jgi:hypothetical protein
MRAQRIPPDRSGRSLNLGRELARVAPGAETVAYDSRRPHCSLQPRSSRVVPGAHAHVVGPMRTGHPVSVPGAPQPRHAARDHRHGAAARAAGTPGRRALSRTHRAGRRARVPSPPASRPILGTGRPESRGAARGAARWLKAAGSAASISLQCHRVRRGGRAAAAPDRRAGQPGRRVCAGRGRGQRARRPRRTFKPFQPLASTSGCRVMAASSRARVLGVATVKPHHRRPTGGRSACAEPGRGSTLRTELPLSGPLATALRSNG